MAKIKTGIMGPLVGKLGPLVGLSWKEIPYVREYSVSDEHPKQRSLAQLDNQAKFKFHPFFVVGFKLEADKKTEIAAGLSVNYYCCHI